MLIFVVKVLHAVLKKSDISTIIDLYIVLLALPMLWLGDQRPDADP
jgi:hypothetical protein